MYAKLKNLILEGLSGASRHYLLLHRRKSNLINQERKRRDQDAKDYGPLYIPDHGIEVDPITSKRFQYAEKANQKIKLLGIAQYKVKKAIPRRIGRENSRIISPFKSKLDMIKRFTLKKGKFNMQNFRVPLAKQLKAARKNRQL